MTLTTPSPISDQAAGELRVLPKDVLDALRFYAHGDHYSIDGDHQQFDTVSGEPVNWMFSEKDDDCTMFEDGGIARAVLSGRSAGFEEPVEPFEGEVFTEAQIPSIPETRHPTEGSADVLKLLREVADYESAGENWHDPLRDWRPRARMSLSTAPTTGSAPVAEWQQRYVGDPRQKGPWERLRNINWAVRVYAERTDHAENGWQVRPLYDRPASPAASVLTGWISAAERLPDVKAGTEREFIVACRRASNGKTYVFAASYLNEMGLMFDDDDCPEDGRPTTGWFNERNDPEYDNAFEKVCDEGDEVTHWMPLPDAPATRDAAPSDAQLHIAADEVIRIANAYFGIYPQDDPMRVDFKAAVFNASRDISLDHKRYRALRDRDLDALKTGGVFAGMIPENVVINGADLDAAADKLLSAIAPMEKT